jgi:hypothetical protein
MWHGRGTYDTTHIIKICDLDNGTRLHQSLRNAEHRWAKGSGNQQRWHVDKAGMPYTGNERHGIGSPIKPVTLFLFFAGRDNLYPSTAMVLQFTVTVQVFRNARLQKHRRIFTLGLAVS